MTVLLLRMQNPTGMGITQGGSIKTIPAAPFGFFVGVGGGAADVSVATVKVFTLADVPLHNIDFLVGGSDFGSGGSVGLLGQNVLHIGDVE